MTLKVYQDLWRWRSSIGHIVTICLSYIVSETFNVE